MKEEILKLAVEIEAEIERRHKEGLFEKYGAEKGEEVWLSFQPGGTRYELDGEPHEDDPRGIACGNCYLGKYPITEENLHEPFTNDFFDQRVGDDLGDYDFGTDGREEVRPV